MSNAASGSRFDRPAAHWRGLESSLPTDVVAELEALEGVLIEGALQPGAARPLAELEDIQALMLCFARNAVLGRLNEAVTE